MVSAVELERLCLAASVSLASRPDPQLEAALRGVLDSSTVPRVEVSPAEYAEATGVSLRTVRRRLADGSLPHRRVGRRVLIPAREVSGGDRRSRSVGVVGDDAGGHDEEADGGDDDEAAAG